MPKVTELDLGADSPEYCDTLYYDGQCPICSREIRSLAAQSDDGLQFVDIHKADLTAVDREQYSRELHLQTADGLWVTGLEANVRAWQHTALAPLANVLLWRYVRPLAEFGYRLWLGVYQWQRRRRTADSSQETR